MTFTAVSTFFVAFLTKYSALQVLGKVGVEKFDPTNEQFDPNRHNAVFQIPDASKPPGTVAAVLKVCHSKNLIAPSD